MPHNDPDGPVVDLLRVGLCSERVMTNLMKLAITITLAGHSHAMRMEGIDLPDPKPYNDAEMVRFMIKELGESYKALEGELFDVLQIIDPPKEENKS